MKIAGIILAGGKGTRINTHRVNKVTLPFLGRPLIKYGIELFKGVANPIIVVVGAFSHSVKKVLKKEKIVYAFQQKRFGTGHATKVGLDAFKNTSNPDLVLVGYGDHMMFYKKETVKRLVKLHEEKKAVVTILTTEYEDPNYLAWGRVIRDKKGNITDSIEQKDATEEQRKIKEINPNFNCFSYKFLNENINKIKRSPVSGEYYLPELIKIAIKQGKKVAGLKVPFTEVGIGINKLPELQLSQDIYQHKSF